MRAVVKLEAGQIISGTLRLKKAIAEGGMGSVWVAEHLVLGRDVAVKLMSKQWAAMPSARTRFLREAKMTAMIDSPHVVRVLDCRLDEADEPYIVLELLRGENLEQRVRRKGVLSIYDVEEIVKQTAAALGAAHRAGLVHRDVKPENVFLVDEPKTFVKVLDFGVAKPKALEECLDVDHLPAGTPQYMSPEHMFEPETTDERSDLFSLAAVAYFALTGRSPFEAESLEAMYFAIEGAKFARPSDLRPELPEAVDDWFVRALARDREKRFHNARELAEALSEAIRAGNSSARIVVPDPTPSENLTPITRSVPGLPSRRIGHRSVALVAAAAALAGLWIWHSGGDVTTANASTIDSQDGGVELTSAMIAPANTTPAPAPTSTTARTTKKPPARPHPVVRSAQPAMPALPTQPATAPAQKKAVETQPPAPTDAPAAEAIDPDQVTSSIKDLIGNAPKPDLDP